jgi:hypothetical protein
MSASMSTVDVEKGSGDYTHLTNTAIQSFGFEGITVTVKDRQTKEPKRILSSVNGIVHAGQYFQCLQSILRTSVCQYHVFQSCFKARTVAANICCLSCP